MLSTETREWLVARAQKFKTAGCTDFQTVRLAFAAKGLSYPESIMDARIREIVAELRKARAVA